MKMFPVVSRLVLCWQSLDLAMADHLVQVPCETCLYLVKRSEAPSLEENNRHDIKMIHKR